MFNVSLDTAVSAPSIKTIQYIPLETNDSSLIGEVSKIICRNHRFYILDKRQNQVLVFGEKGDFITSIHRVGNGPDEYVMDYDMDIDSMGRIYIADVSQQCIVRYSGAHYDQFHRIKVGKTFLEFAVSTPEQIYLSGVSQTEGVIDVGLASFDTERNRLDALEKSLYGDELATMLFFQQHLFRSAAGFFFTNVTLPTFTGLPKAERHLISFGIRARYRLRKKWISGGKTVNLTPQLGKLLYATSLHFMKPIHLCI